MAYYYNRKYTKLPPLKEGNKVWLLRKNITLKRSNKKLDYKNLGPYPIKKKLSKEIYKLNLLKYLGIYPTFYILLLIPILEELRENGYELEIIDNLYPVEAILDYKIKEGKSWYLIKWENYGLESNNWESIENIALELI